MTSAIPPMADGPNRRPAGRATHPPCRGARQAPDWSSGPGIGDTQNQRPLFRSTEEGRA